MGSLYYIDKKLTRIYKVPFCFYCIIFNFWSDNAIRQRSVIDTIISTFNIVCKIFTDETVEQRPQDELLEVPSIYCPTHFIGYFPNLRLQLFSLLYACHIIYLLLLMSSLLSIFNNSAILERVAKSGCETLVHHFDTVEGSFFNCSANHLPVFFFSTKTNLSLFISLISIIKLNLKQR